MHKMLVQTTYSFIETVTQALRSMATYLVLKLSLPKAIPPFGQVHCFRRVEKVVKSVNSKIDHINTFGLMQIYVSFIIIPHS